MQKEGASREESSESGEGESAAEEERGVASMRFVSYDFIRYSRLAAVAAIRRVAVQIRWGPPVVLYRFDGGVGGFSGLSSSLGRRVRVHTSILVSAPLSSPLRSLQRLKYR